MKRNPVQVADVCHPRITRREFLGVVGAGVGALAPALADDPFSRPAFRGRNVVIIRFGGGVRRLESIVPERTYAPFVAKDLVRRGTLFPRMEIAQSQVLTPSHGEGTLNLLTGRYDKYQDIENGFLKDRFEARVPTLFEYLRKTFDVAPHQTLIVNGEDRPDE